MNHINPAELLVAKPEDLLKKMLSTKSYLPIPIDNDADKRVSRQIGKGQCDTIYTFPTSSGKDQVVKLPNSPAKIAELRTDARVHAAVEEAFQQHGWLEINIPRFGEWVMPDTQPFWDEFSKSSDNYKGVVPSCGLISARIPPLPLPLRAALIHSLCPKAVVARKSDILGRAENADCLVRLYLGRRGVGRKNSKVDPGSFSLRNFPLHVDEMEELGLDTGYYARVMAESLAVLHWRVGTDGDDVEFVLGGCTAPSPPPSPHSSLAVDGQQQQQEKHTPEDEAVDKASRVAQKWCSMGIWLLDFNQCSIVSFSPTSPLPSHSADDNEDNGSDNKVEEGLKKLVNGFRWNDPYYPRPGSTDSRDRKLWGMFKERYSAISEAIVGTGSERDLPERFIKGVEKEGRKRENGGGLFG